MRFTCFAVLLVLAGCKDDSPVECDTADDCLQGGVHGTCEPSPASDHSWCAFPDDFCGSGDRWGILAGDGLASVCVARADAGLPDATPDSGPDADLPDAGPDAGPPMLSSKVIVPAALQDKLFVFSPDTLAPLVTVTLPDRTGNGNAGAAISSGTLWVTSSADAIALDPATLTVKAGAQPHFDTLTECLPGTGVFNDVGMFCLSATIDQIQLRTGAGMALSKQLAMPDPKAAAASASRVVASYGAGFKTVGVLDTNLTPVVGSPVTVAGVSGATMVAVSDEENRFAAAGGKDVQLFDRAGLTSAGSHTFTQTIAGIAFDAVNHRLVVVLTDGKVAALNTADGSIAVAEVQRVTAVTFSFPVVDVSRDQVYLLGNNQNDLAVLDAATLAHVPGSPVTLPAQGKGLTLF